MLDLRIMWARRFDELGLGFRGCGILGCSILGCSILGCSILGCSSGAQPEHSSAAACSTPAAGCASEPGSSATATGGPPMEAGAGDPSATATGNPSLPGPPSAGTYTVPVPEALAPYATFPISSIRLRARGSDVELSYDLPALLVGDEQGIALRGGLTSAGVYELSGDAGRATCRESAGSWTCDESLVSVNVDADKLNQRLQGMPDEEMQARQQVADIFAVDPIGILRFTPQR